MMLRKNDLPEAFLKRLETQLDEMNFKNVIENFSKNAVRGIRINKNRISYDDFLKKSKFKLKQLPFCNDGYIFIGDEKGGNSIEHLSGQIYFQEPSSMLAVISSEIEKESRPLKVLDLCASPGGKTSQIAVRIDKDSVLYSNEIIKSRAEILFSNVERQGFSNVVILNEKPENLMKFEGFFDYVFVDAPCSGEGMFRKNPETIGEWSEQNVEMCAGRQKDILDIATKLVSPNGKLVYSTCTFSLEEDEQTVEYLVNEKGFELQKVSNEIEKLTIPSKANCKNGNFARKHYYDEFGEGQFVAVLKNKGQNEVSFLSSKKHLKSICVLSKKENEIFDEFCKKSLKVRPNGKLIKVGDNLYLLPNAVSDGELAVLDELKFVSLGVRLGSMEKDRFQPHQNLFMVLDGYFNFKIELGDEEVKKYFHGEELMCDITPSINGVFAVVTKNNMPLGGVRISSGRLKNLYPKGKRL